MSNKNKDKDSEWKLYTKAYEIASRTGQIKTGTYGDPEQSGILDNYYHLISTEGKLLARFSLDQMRVSKQKGNGNGSGSGCACFMLGIFVSLLAGMTLPKFLTTEEFRKSGLAMNSIYSIAKECAIKNANNEINPTFNVPELDHPYKFYPQDGDCNGDLNNLLSAISDKPTRHPSFFFNMVTGQKSCLHEGPTGSLYGCSARRDGEW